MKKAFFLLCLFWSVSAKQTLSGDISGTFGPDVYRVTETVTVPSGKSLTFDAGSELFFEPFTGIVVKGSLIINGTQDSPVRLTSIRDTGIGDGSPEPFDWNGIEVQETAEQVSLQYLSISHSVFGINIKAARTKVRIQNALFNNNGYASVVRVGENSAVVYGKLFSVSWNMETVQPVTESVKFHSDVPSEKTPGKNKAVFLSLNIGGLGVAAAGLAIMSVSTVQRNRNVNEYSVQKDPHWASIYRNRIIQNRNMQITGAVLAGVGLTSAGVTWLF